MYDYAIVGGGIVGLSTGMELSKRYPNSKIAVIEKESSVAKHQTGNNSGVIHSGIYYKPGSFKARFARKGSQSMVDFCKEHGLDYDVCGKVIVATSEEACHDLIIYMNEVCKMNLQLRKSALKN